MAKKIEKWTDEILKTHGITLPKGKHSHRETAIVCASILDLALAELLETRLMQFPKEIEDFLGLDEDGRAPAGSFGARIQLALLIGIIDKSDAAVLRAYKLIRNRFAHRVNVTLSDVKVVEAAKVLFDTLGDALRKVVTPDGKPLSEYRTDVTAFCQLLHTGLVGYQTYFASIRGILRPIEYREQFSRGAMLKHAKANYQGTPIS
jgi:hypothetical protein